MVQSVPGVGPITSAVVESELGDSKRFENANQVRALAGLDPAVCPSEKFEGKMAHFSNRRSPLLRETLYHVALRASQ